MKELVLNTDKFLLESIQEKKNANLLNSYRASFVSYCQSHRKY